MTPTRSTAGRRKRASTMQAVDFLNSVMDTQGLGPESRPAQSARPYRRMRKLGNKNSNRNNPHRSIWDIPDSPGALPAASKSSRFGTAPPTTPRRSGRLQGHVQAQSSPIRRPRRLITEGSEGIGDTGHENTLPVQQLPQDGTNEEAIENPDNEESDSDGSPQVNLFSDDAIDPAQSAPSQPAERDQSRESPPRNTGPGLEADDGLDTQALNTGGLDGPRSPVAASDASLPAEVNSTERAGSPSIVVQIERPAEQPLSSLSPAPSDDEDQEMRDDDDEDVEMGDSDDSGSIYETVAEPASSDSSLSMSQDEHFHVASFEKSSKATSHPALQASTLRSAPDNGNKLNDRPTRTHEIPDQDDLDSFSQQLEQELDDLCEDVWLKPALEFGGQRPNWDVLIEEARILTKSVTSFKAEEFEDITTLISHSYRLYADICQALDTSQPPSQKDVRLCANLLDSILREGNQLLDSVYYIAIERKKSSRNTSRRLVDEFEARVIPAMVQLTLACFKTSYIGSRHFSGAYGYLRATMNCLLRFCDRISSLIAEGYVPGSSRNQRLRKSLQKLLEAWQFELLKWPEDDPSSRDSQSPSPTERDENSSRLNRARKPWTDDEIHALLTGLQRYQGKDRYISILGDFGKQLDGRTIRELREQAQATCDKFVPMIEDELYTREGRRKWRWLLSVRE